MVYICSDSYSDRSISKFRVSVFDNKLKFLASLGTLKMHQSEWYTDTLRIAVDKDDNLYVCDSAGGCVRVY